MTEIQPYEVAIMFVLGLIIGAGLLKIWQKLKTDGVFGCPPAASLPSTENIEKVMGGEPKCGPYRMNVISPKPDKKPGEVYCPVCGVLALKENRPGDDTVMAMNFQYHCRQCYKEIFGR